MTGGYDKYTYIYSCCYEKGNQEDVALGGLVVSVLATGPKVRGFDDDRGWAIDF
jgi:hypothetical protein